MMACKAGTPMTVLDECHKLYRFNRYEIYQVLTMRMPWLFKTGFNVKHTNLMGAQAEWAEDLGAGAEADESADPISKGHSVIADLCGEGELLRSFCLTYRCLTGALLPD